MRAWTTAAVAASALLCAGLGCERRAEGPAAQRLVEIRLGEPANDYVYRTDDGALRNTGAYVEIPPTHRGVVMVYHPSMQIPRDDSEAVYVADLLGRSPGDTLKAHRVRRADFLERSIDAGKARRHARLVALAASEMAQLDEDSRRSAASEASEDAFRQILPRIVDRPADAGEAPEAGASGGARHETDR